MGPLAVGLLIPWWFGQGAPAGPTATLSGNFITSATRDTTIRIGTRVMTITLATETWVASGATFNAQRANIVNGMVSSGADPAGWNAVVIPMLLTNLGSVVRTSATVVTVTFPGADGISGTSAYRITADETITVTVPGSAVVGGSPIVASPTKTITYVGPITPTVTVDFSNVTTNGGGTITPRMGFLSGYSGTPGAPDAVITPLLTTYFRSSSFSRYTRALGLGVTRFDFVQSDRWGYPSSAQHTGAFWPYDAGATDWPTFLTSEAAAANGKTYRCEYWNEPDGVAFWPGTVTQHAQACADIYTAHKSNSPKPLFVGPSYASYNLTNILAYLTRCLTAGPGGTAIEVNIVAWHSNAVDYTVIPTEVAAVKAAVLAAGTYGPLNIQGYEVNEAGAQRVQYSGASLMSSNQNLELANVDGTLSDWLDHTTGTGNAEQLDGMLTPTSFLPRSRWYAARAYARLGGSRVGATSGAAEVGVLASADGKIVIWHYNPASTTTVIDATISLVLNGLASLPAVAGLSLVLVTIKRIPFQGEAAASEPTVSQIAIAAVSGGSATIPIGTLEMDQVYEIEVSDLGGAASGATRRHRRTTALVSSHGAGGRRRR